MDKELLVKQLCELFGVNDTEVLAVCQGLMACTLSAYAPHPKPLIIDEMYRIGNAGGISDAEEV